MFCENNFWFTRYEPFLDGSPFLTNQGSYSFNRRLKSQGLNVEETERGSGNFLRVVNFQNLVLFSLAFQFKNYTYSSFNCTQLSLPPVPLMG